MSNALYALRLVIVLVVVLMMVACSQSQVEFTDYFAGDSGYVSGEYGFGLLAGLFVGCVDVGDKLVYVKGKVIGQSCVDCYGVDGNASIDLSYLKFGGQYGDYLVYVL